MGVTFSVEIVVKSVDKKVNQFQLLIIDCIYLYYKYDIFTCLLSILNIQATLIFTVLVVVYVLVQYANWLLQEVPGLGAGA